MKTDEVEARVLAALHNHLLAPDVVAEAVEAYRIERGRLLNDHRKRRSGLTRDLAVIERKLKRVLEVTMNEDHIDRKAIVQQIVELQTEQKRLEAELAEGDNPAPITVHPSASERYRAKFGQIHEALTKGDAASLEAITILRDLIDQIVVTPTERPAPVELPVVGNLAALLVENTPGTGVAESMVAGARNQLQGWESREFKGWKVRFKSPCNHPIGFRCSRTWLQGARPLHPNCRQLSDRGSVDVCLRDGQSHRGRRCSVVECHERERALRFMAQVVAGPGG